ncbi:MAG: N-acetyltransferase [Comamonadaceae bacterium]|nr:N-acetyltransferase [Comamonadaceae bacterium]
MQVIHCTEAHLDVLSELFNDYRIFYEQPSDVPACRAFIQKNLQQNCSKIFLLLDDEGRAVGFSQLYPSICSISMRPYHYLSDLYVATSTRRNGHARHLMNYITDHFTNLGSQRLTLDTATSNKIAQGLYESLGYEREEVYITYHQVLKTPA